MKEYIKPLLEMEECYVADTAIASGNCWMCLGGGVTAAEAHAAGYQGTIVPGPGCGNKEEPLVCYPFGD